ncbi:hypothetical protein MMC31_002849, partial [Peltigera leucophlebia]|nr:hypothetical protein [Peltigera leucophlebia]
KLRTRAWNKLVYDDDEDDDEGDDEDDDEDDNDKKTKANCEGALMMMDDDAR